MIKQAKKMSPLPVLFVFIGAIGSQLGLGADITWNHNGKARLVGNGCSNEDSQIINAGNDVSVIFSNLGVNLSGFEGGQLVARKGCRIIIPAKVSRGRYIGQLDESLIYGYIQHGESEADISYHSRFLGVQTNMGRHIDKRSRHRSEDFAEERRRQRFRFNRFCNGRDTPVQYRGRIGIEATRQSTEDDIIVQIDGLDIRFEMKAQSKPCPNRIGRRRGRGRRHHLDPAGSGNRTHRGGHFHSSREVSTRRNS